MMLDIFVKTQQFQVLWVISIVRMINIEEDLPSPVTELISTKDL